MPEEKIQPPVSPYESEHFLEIESGSAAPERSAAQERSGQDRPGEGAQPAAPMLPVSVPALPLAQEKTELRIEIERVLEEDLAYIYSQLPEKQRQQFRAEGERIAEAIEDLFQKTRLTISRVLSLIRNWLMLIPGVDRFFVEREAKIKADKILGMYRSEHES